MGVAEQERADMEMEDSPSDSELLEGLEDDDYREQRIREIQSDITRRQINAEFVSRGGYREYTSEKEVMDVGLKEAKAVVHFFHPRFKRCEIMDTHLELIAHQHLGTKFLKVHVENVPFLVEKLRIKVLPCVITFRQGVARDRLVGFEDLGKSDEFTTKMLENRLFEMGAITSFDQDKDANHGNHSSDTSDYDD
ncbi:hypothetical protein E3P89_02930 [Wallemia ichthyophaga]|uniref:Thioredoxin domain-containing protein n=2 Tax=Wallemia ichthyophaga TaxID=245174 RepID=A0A4T0GPG9_WALIC|nr:hypothetical protein E3P91_03030 [Wallemia ichthyophaga]TIA79846.1 hypothetical protein E3P98_03023 [Wallemia ichthyophaga]TIB03463.1 hypothetical protein E3P95_00519 [Wallemia ichthyophaga]TIB08818.1 hypothetical protein E3P90_03542 [Wallemia ichthyophaga]TIB10189.1 hypothetical protein E3P93_02955 [Wallemia ichthyophaga]